MKTTLTLIFLLLAGSLLHAQTWNGSSSDDWFTSSNWTPGSVPGSSSSVTIPGSLSTYPKLTGNVSIAALTMQSGSSVNLNAQNLSTTGNLSLTSATLSGGGAFSCAGAGSVTVQSCHFTANVSITAYTGAGHIYDDSITGNLVISNSTSQSGDNYIDGNYVTGTFSLTQASNNNPMLEGYGSPSSQANVFLGNANLYLTGSQSLTTSYSRATQWGAKLTVSHTGSGGLIMFNSAGSVGGDFSLTSSSGAGSDAMNNSASSVVPVAGKVDVSVTSGASFTMFAIKGATSGGNINITNPATANVRFDTLKSNISITGYAGNGYLLDNYITGNVVFSNSASQIGDNYLDGNYVTGTFSLTQTSNNNQMLEGYGSPSSHANVFAGNANIYLTGSQSLYTSYSRATQWGSNLTISHTGSGGLFMFNSAGSVGGDFSLTSGSGAGLVSINVNAPSVVSVAGKVDVSATSGSNFTMFAIKGAISGGNINVTNPGIANVRFDTLKSNLSITGYTGSGYLLDNYITGNVVFSNSASQTGDNFLDGNYVTGTFSLTQASNNTGMYESTGSPSSHSNVFMGNANIYFTGSQSLYTSYNRATQWGAKLTVSHTGSGGLFMFNSAGSVGGDFSLISGTGAGSDAINPNPPAVVPIAGKVDIGVTSGANFTMLAIKGATTGGNINLTSPGAVNFRNDTLKSNVSITNYLGVLNFFDNDIADNLILSNVAAQTGDNFIDGNYVTGTFSLTQASNTSQMNEGYGSPSSHANVFAGNANMYLTGTQNFNTSASRATQWGSNLTVSHTGSGSLFLFVFSGSVGGNFSLTSNNGGNFLNDSYNNRVDVGGTCNVTISGGGTFHMNRIKNLTSGGNVSVTAPGQLIMRSDTLKCNVAISKYYSAGYFYDNNIDGGVSISNDTLQNGENYIDGNNINGSLNLSCYSNNSNMYFGYGSPSSNPNVVWGSTNILDSSVKDMYMDYSRAGTYKSNFSTTHISSGNLYLFYNGGTVLGDFSLHATGMSGSNYLNPNAPSVVVVGGMLGVQSDVNKEFTLRSTRNLLPGDSIQVSNASTITIRDDTLKSHCLLNNFNSNFHLYNNKITGRTFLRDSSTKTSDYYLDGNYFNGNFTMVHNSSNTVYEGYGASSGNWVSGIDSIVNPGGAGTINLSYSHSHRTDSIFALNAAGNVVFSTGNPLVFGGATTGKLRNYGTQQLVLPLATLAKTGGATLYLEAPLSITNQFTFTTGYLNGMLPNTLFFLSGAGQSGASDNSHATGQVAKVGNAAFTFPTGDGYYYYPCGITAPSSSTDTFYAQYKRQSPANAGYTPSQKDASIDHVSQAEHWLISRSTSTTSNVKVTLSFNAHSGVTNLSALTVAHWYNPGGGNKWVDEGNGSTTGGVSGGTITSNNTISTFSPFTLASTTTANPLPVTLSDFNAVAVGHSARISWHSAVETNLAYYEVQRSADGQAFTTLGKVAPQGSGQAYSFSDFSPMKGLNLYRLALIDLNGALQYSPVKSLRFDESGAVTGVISYPNPAPVSLFITGLEQYQDATLCIRNLTGQLIQERSLNGQATLEIPLNNLPSGMYLLQIDNAQGAIYRGSFLH